MTDRMTDAELASALKEAYNYELEVFKKIAPEKMQDLRCANCHKKLCEYNVDAGIIEIMCPKCGFTTKLRKRAPESA